MAVSQSNRDEQDLIAKIRAGDQSALGFLIQSYYEQLAMLVIRYLDSADAADDVLQELFLRIWNGRVNWEVRGSLKVYMYTAARNSALHAVARRDARSRAEGKAAIYSEHIVQHDASAELEQSELAAAARAVVAELPERCREIYLLSSEHGLSYSEIAAMLGISVSTVKTQMGRAFTLLDARLAPFLVVALVLAS